MTQSPVEGGGVPLMERGPSAEVLSMHPSPSAVLLAVHVGASAAK